MAFRWVVDAEHPAGHLVELTPEEEEQRASDDAAGTAFAEAEARRRANEDVMVESLRTRMQDALDLAGKIEGGTSTAAEQRQGLVLSLRGLVRLTRVTLDLLDRAD